MIGQKIICAIVFLHIIVYHIVNNFITAFPDKCILWKTSSAYLLSSDFDLIVGGGDNDILR